MSLPNYIPVHNMKDFNYDVLAYYNQYYASEKTTQDRRIRRNYINNQRSIAKSNINPFFQNPSVRVSFFYSFSQNYMFVQDKNTLQIQVYIYLANKNCWCRVKNNAQCNEIKEIIKNG